jgi:pimeloyl-ACP methyl ester carboxylesterase
MTNVTFEHIYRDVSQAQKDQLLAFRTLHPVKKLAAGKKEWDYLAGGQGEETLVLLTGGLNSSEVWFQIMTGFEKTHRVLSIRYPSIATVAELVEGIAAILDAEHIERAHLLGESLGGMVAQCLVRRYPGRVDSLILASTAAPEQRLVPRMKRQEKLVSLFPVGLLLSLSKRRVLHLLSGLPEEERSFWKALLKEKISSYVTKAWLISQYKLLADYCASYHFAPADLEHWPGAILILQADDDELIQRLAREPLTAFHPQAQVHTFHNANHIPLITKRDEYINVVKQFLREMQRVL